MNPYILWEHSIEGANAVFVNEASTRVPGTDGSLLSVRFAFTGMVCSALRLK